MIRGNKTDQRSFMRQKTELRIISGKYKGQKIASPGSSETHPMGAREKLALFNMVNVRDLTVLDAFAGSGALGFEALSRGAKSVVFVESSPRAAEIIKQNLANLAEHDPDVLSRAEVRRQKVAQFAAEKNRESGFDLILADPPYEHIEMVEIEALTGLLEKGGVLVLSSPARSEAPNLRDVELTSSRIYAGARLSLYQKIA